MTYLESWENFESENCVFYSKILIRKFAIIWAELDLTSAKSKVDNAIGLNRSLRAKWPRKQVSHGMLVTYILVTFCDLALTSFESDLCTHAVPFLDKCQRFGWVWALCGPSNRPESHNAKSYILTFGLTLTWQVTLILKCKELNMCVSKRVFERHLAHLPTTLSLRDNLGG